jgi:hypothetical protein
LDVELNSGIQNSTFKIQNCPLGAGRANRSGLCYEKRKFGVRGDDDLAGGDLAHEERQRRHPEIVDNFLALERQDQKQQAAASVSPAK